MKREIVKGAPADFLPVYSPKCVQVARRDVVAYLRDIPVNETGHKKFTYEQAVGLQVLQRDLAARMALVVIDGGCGDVPPTPRKSEDDMEDCA